MSFYRLVETGCWITGLCLLAVFASNIALGELQRQEDILSYSAQLELVEQLESGNHLTSKIDQVAEIDVDQSLWSESRKLAYRALPKTTDNKILGILSIPNVGLEVPIYDGASNLNMDRGVARIEGTPIPNQGGNSGIAGHRDGYFRVLKDVEIGELISVKNSKGELTYRISEILIVEPYQVEVLANTEDSVLTLVTCYPFYFVGHAQKRYIVKAVRQS
jgi:sortase A